MTDRQRHAVVAGLLVFGAVLIVAGFLRDELSFVLRRAINICLECIGIG